MKDEKRTRKNKVDLNLVQILSHLVLCLLPNRKHDFAFKRKKCGNQKNFRKLFLQLYQTRMIYNSQFHIFFAVTYIMVIDFARNKTKKCKLDI